MARETIYAFPFFPVLLTPKGTQDSLNMKRTQIDPLTMTVEAAPGFLVTFHHVAKCDRVLQGTTVTRYSSTRLPTVHGCVVFVPKPKAIERYAV